jgi:peptidoglycan/xylan/chitin deacetylase (PgdA/CDA1 family)
MTVSTLWSRALNGYRRRAALWWARRPAVLRNPAPLVSFTFDDFPRSALLTGGRILEEHGVRGTYYVSLGLMGQRAPTGEMFLAEDVPAVVQRGHELGCHTFAHCDSGRTAPRRFEASVRDNQHRLEQLLPGAGFPTLSYPISAPRVGTKRRCARHFQGCRGGGQTLNSGTVDLNYLAAFFIEQSRDRLEAVLELVDDNVRRNGWLILATHDVSEAPTRYGCTPREFERVVRQVVRSGATVLPVGRALQAAGLVAVTTETSEDESSR